MGRDPCVIQDDELRSKWLKAELTRRKYLVSGEFLNLNNIFFKTKSRA